MLSQNNQGNGGEKSIINKGKSIIDNGKSIIDNDIKGYETYLKDESRLCGRAGSISFPGTEQDIKKILSGLNEKTPVTIQGARTGITGGAVPSGGHILNMGRMNRATGIRFSNINSHNAFYITVQPGLLLSELKKTLETKIFDTTGWSEQSLTALDEFKKRGHYFFPPDPTETGTSIGGMVACNASGAKTFYYGSTRNYIEALRIILADGSVICLRRGGQKAYGRTFSLMSETGSSINGNLPGYRMPDVKNASGYFSLEDMDLLDLFIGSEGTLGIITEIELRLLEAPGAVWGIMAFFPSESGAIKFVRDVRKSFLCRSSDLCGNSIYRNSERIGSTVLAAIEYFNNKSLNLLKEMKKENPAFHEIPDMPQGTDTAIYTEYHGENDDILCDTVMQAADLLAACGGGDEYTWTASKPKELEHIYSFRHAVPEAVNFLIDGKRLTEPALMKLGTDMAVPDDRLEETVELYNRSLRENGLDSVMFGHIGNNHIHVNIIPRNIEDYNKGKELYFEWARRIIAIGGTISAEHGIGKLKIALLKEMYGEEGVWQMKSVKILFDPYNILNRGNLFD